MDQLLPIARKRGQVIEGDECVSTALSRRQAPPREVRRALAEGVRYHPIFESYQTDSAAFSFG